MGQKAGLDGFFALTPFAMFSAMPRLMALFVIASVLSSCTSAGVGDYVPNWAGGLPKNAPPRPGTPEYDAYIQKLRDRAGREETKDPLKAQTEAGSSTQELPPIH